MAALDSDIIFPFSSNDIKEHLGNSSQGYYLLRHLRGCLESLFTI